MRMCFCSLGKNLNILEVQAGSGERAINHPGSPEFSRNFLSHFDARNCDSGSIGRSSGGIPWKDSYMRWMRKRRFDPFIWRGRKRCFVEL
jgi:hypothetical protein